MEQIFATHGVPTIRSDNGPPFTSHEFDAYMAEKYKKITPLWPKQIQRQKIS